MPLARPVAAEPLPGFRLRLRFADGVEGEVDLAHLAGRGVFARWAEEPGAFERVRIGPYGELAWDDDLDLCADALYFDLTGHLPEPAAAPGHA